ncbi:MAG: hypothetical protein HYR62_08855 [Actinobacteria bacterium]|nr:hypothetical protein [Actinomycetota bacterium]MBI3688431.1 hypothetical protein [Actinomycetota bacterium]
MPTGADEAHRDWLRGHLDHAAAWLGVNMAAEPVYGWHDRTIGTAVTTADTTRWLRVVSEHRQWAHGDPHTLTWSTAHGDLHWGNLTHPDCWLLDWEGWGTAPSGYDAASLYCASIMQPDIAARVYVTFADLLDTRDGVVAQLAAAARLLRHVDLGEHADVAGPLHRHARRLVTVLER